MSGLVGLKVKCQGQGLGFGVSVSCEPMKYCYYSSMKNLVCGLRDHKGHCMTITLFDSDLMSTRRGSWI